MRKKIEGNTENKNSPQKVPLSEKVIRFCCGSYHAMALTEKEEIYFLGGTMILAN
jgi:alpha-tubulin suppressor-like RCC1 family protein